MFKFKRKLLIHIPTHSGLKPFKCEGLEVSPPLDHQSNTFTYFVSCHCGECSQITKSSQQRVGTATRSTLEYNL
uniref:Uncharacterized protein n=1 Tax=Timema tahoe TaxID=61484 RepID=A0A7R9FK05_9NEOP|nr:unnamed protein product [Timema tahoe]